MGLAGWRRALPAKPKPLSNHESDKGDNRQKRGTSDHRLGENAGRKVCHLARLNGTDITQRQIQHFKLLSQSNIYVALQYSKRWQWGQGVEMAKIKLATWNINSVRLRAELVTSFLKAHKPDVLCLQETKVPDPLFPTEPFNALGYTHQAISGQKGYHGVAILSRLPFKKTVAKAFCGKDDTRHVSVLFEAGLELHNFYVPAGGDIPDVKANPKFAHKLDFLREMERVFSKQRKKRSQPVVLVGDLNVAPLENDVWSHKQLLDVVSHTPVETDLLAKAFKAFDWHDVTRSFVPADKKIYSWWSYRAADWEESDRGRRLDHIWVSPALKDGLSHHTILREARGWDRPSDHVPVMTTISF